MLNRFAAASATAAVLIAAAVVVVSLSPILSFARIYPIPVIWCVVPFIWGSWALVAPKTWVPDRLPIWGAILGFIGGILGAFVLNIPSRIAGFAVPILYRVLALLAITLLYYFGWILVELVYQVLGRPTELQKPRMI